MKLTVVGCAPAYTRRTGRASSCYLVEGDGAAVVMDLGQGAFAELSRYRRPEDVDGVLISHLHADHLVDLIPLRHYLRYEAEARVALHGPADLRRRMDAFQAEQDFLAPLPGPALEEATFELAGFAVEAARVTHIPDSFAFRVSRDGGAGIVYSGDCGVADDLLQLVRRGDTLLCEAAFGAQREASGGNHLTAGQAASVAARAGAARLVLTHILDAHSADAARAAAAALFEGEVVLAEPGLLISL